VQVDIEFHGITYAVCITVHADVLIVEIEDRDSFNKWRGEFTLKCELQQLYTHFRYGAAIAPSNGAQKPFPNTRAACFDLADVEDITSKTGNFKKFVVFVRMLQSAALQQSDSVFIDLLTYQDLEILKAKKQPHTTAVGAQQPLPANTKRYLILTYASEFDRVHYPLPLLQEDPPDPQRLITVIHQLRQQLQQLQQKQQQQVALPLEQEIPDCGNRQGTAAQQRSNFGTAADQPGM